MKKSLLIVLFLAFIIVCIFGDEAPVVNDDYEALNAGSYDVSIDRAIPFWSILLLNFSPWPDLSINGQQYVYGKYTVSVSEERFDIPSGTIGRDVAYIPYLRPIGTQDNSVVSARDFWSSDFSRQIEVSTLDSLMFNFNSFLNIGCKIAGFVGTCFFGYRAVYRAIESGAIDTECIFNGVLSIGSSLLGNGLSLFFDWNRRRTIESFLSQNNIQYRN